MSNALSPSELASRVELALTAPAATREDVECLCGLASKAGVYGVAFASSRVELARAVLEDSSTKTIGLVGFPWGSVDSDAKRFEAEAAIDLGAQELDVLLNIGRLREGDHKFVTREMRDIVEAADELPVFVSVDTRWLIQEEILQACALAQDTGVVGVACGAGLAPPIPTDLLRAIREAVGPKFLIKAGGDTLDLAGARAQLDAGANRLCISAKPGNRSLQLP